MTLVHQFFGFRTAEQWNSFVKRHPHCAKDLNQLGNNATVTQIIQVLEKHQIQIGTDLDTQEVRAPASLPQNLPGHGHKRPRSEDLPPALDVDVIDRLTQENKRLQHLYIQASLDRDILSREKQAIREELEQRHKAFAFVDQQMARQRATYQRNIRIIEMYLRQVNLTESFKKNVGFPIEKFLL